MNSSFLLCRVNALPMGSTLQGKRSKVFSGGGDPFEREGKERKLVELLHMKV